MGNNYSPILIDWRQGVALTIFLTFVNFLNFSKFIVEIKLIIFLFFETLI